MSTVGPELQQSGITADSFEELAQKAIDDQFITRGLGMVCGPITSGGTGNQEYNLEIFNAAINGLEHREIRLFNQIPYEFGLRRLAHKWEEAGNAGYCMPILTIFYARLFDAGIVTSGWFIPGWKSSVGATWERKQLLERGCEVQDLDLVDIQEFLLLKHDPVHVAHLMQFLR